MVKRILRHDFSDPANKRWLVQCALDGDEDETWESFEVLKDVEAFHTYCAAHGMSAGLNVPKKGNSKRQPPPPTTPSDLPLDRPNKRRSRPKGRQAPTSEPITLNTVNQDIAPKKRRGRPIKQTTTSTSGTSPDEA